MVGGSIERAKAKYIGGGDRFGGNRHNIPNNAAQSGICAAKRFEGAGVVVGFYFERDIVVAIKSNNPGIVAKGRSNPLFSQFFGRRDNTAFEEAINYLTAPFLAVPIR